MPTPAGVPGRLPPERDLRAEYGAARNTLRKGVSAISADGSVTHNVGHGTFIAPETAEFGEIMKNVTGDADGAAAAMRGHMDAIHMNLFGRR